MLHRLCKLESVSLFSNFISNKVVDRRHWIVSRGVTTARSITSQKIGIRRQNDSVAMRFRISSSLEKKTMVEIISNLSLAYKIHEHIEIDMLFWFKITFLFGG